MAKPTQKKAEVSYPCPWGFKIIGTSEEAVRQGAEVCLEALCSGREYTLELSNVSGKGKYTSLNLSIQVENEVERNAIFAALADNPDIMMVM